MSTKGETFPSSEVPDLYGTIDTAARQNVGIEIETNDTLGVTLEGAEALAGSPVPNLKDPIFKRVLGCKNSTKVFVYAKAIQVGDRL